MSSSPAAIPRAKSFLHGVTECRRIRAPSPGIIPGQISFEIGHFSEKPESIDNTPNHFVKIRPLVLAKKSGEIIDVVIAGAHDPLAELAVVEIRNLRAPQFVHRQRANGVAIENADRDFGKIVKVSDFGALGGRPDFLCDDFLERETGNISRNKFQQIEVTQSYLGMGRMGRTGRSRMLTCSFIFTPFSFSACAQTGLAAQPSSVRYQSLSRSNRNEIP